MSVIIGISASILIDKDGIFPGYRRCYVNQDYITALINNGAVPLIIPMNSNIKIIEEQISKIDGLILSGGHDISPKIYNEEPLDQLGTTLYERDHFDIMLLEKAKQKNIPILGICRGAQLINVYHGGTLYQDIKYRNGITYRHWQNYNPSETTHYIKISDEGSLLFDILKEKEIEVNSFHHQTIKDVASNFNVVAQAKDGVVEAIEAKDYKFLLGIQWHPEMLCQNIDKMNLIFERLVKESKKRC